jgi:hypothetical protein
MKRTSKAQGGLFDMADDDVSEADESEKKGRRKISGDLTYNSTPGGLERTLQGIIKAQKPQKVDVNYIQTVLQVAGGTGGAQLPVLKKLGIVDSSGTPSKIYDDFRNEKKRSHAAFQMLQNGYKSIFEVNAHAHKAPESEVENIIAQVTGLDADDPIIHTIYACFDKVRGFINPAENVYDALPEDAVEDGDTREKPEDRRRDRRERDIGLTYQINIVLPQSGNIDTYNLIFKSLRENLLDWEN